MPRGVIAGVRIVAAIVFGLGLSVSGPARATQAGAADPALTREIGELPCETWLALRARRTASTDIVEAWAMGFASAYASDHAMPARDVTKEQVLPLLDSQCRSPGLSDALWSAIEGSMRRQAYSHRVVAGSTWLAGAWQVGPGYGLCAAMLVRLGDDGSLAGAISGNIIDQPDDLVAWTIPRWAQPDTLVATFHDGRTVTYRAVPSSPGEWNFINAEDPRVQRIDIAPEDPQLLLRVVSRGASAGMRYNRVEEACKARTDGGRH